MLLTLDGTVPCQGDINRVRPDELNEFLSGPLCGDFAVVILGVRHQS